MPSKDEHIAKADANAALANGMKLDSPGSIDWALVMIFYAAMHYVEAYLDKAMGIHLRSHSSRDNYVGRDSHLKRIFVEYQDLKSFGYTARYEVSKFKPTDFTDTATKHYNRIKEHIAKIL